MDPKKENTEDTAGLKTSIMSATLEPSWIEDDLQYISTGVLFTRQM